ncbi:maleylpyruvate isomerase N-terminal domain-containing protein [Streptomyces pseudogriseolus]|uniref:maleylpyruvate isomerase N-terminal domain-containing protein n=1 Tax=Streptomyces pseudogriseolus TaxID=36817 RepID=UPI003FA2DADE
MARDITTGDFTRSWNALLAAVATTPGEDFDRPSGCRGWLVRDLVCHLVVDAQDVPHHARHTCRHRAHGGRDDVLGPRRSAHRRRPAGRARPAAGRRLRRPRAAEVPPGRRGFRGRAGGRTRRPRRPREHQGQGADRRRLPHGVRPRMDAAPPGPRRPSAVRPEAPGRDAGLRPHRAGTDRGRPVPRGTVRHGRPAARHGPAHAHRRRDGRAGRPHRAAAADPGLTSSGRGQAKAAAPGIGGPPPSVSGVTLSTSCWPARRTRRHRRCRSGPSCSPGPT